MVEKKVKVVSSNDTEILVEESFEAQREEDKEWAKNEVADFSGKYISAVGRRKQATARVRLYENGKGIIMVNGMRAAQYFSGEGAGIVAQPLKATGHHRDLNFSVITKSGGKQGQVGAVRLGIARALFIFAPETKDVLKTSGFLTRDPRQVERKKPGLRKARKAPQWSKR